MTPNTLRAVAAVLAAFALVLNGAAAGHIDPLSVGEAVVALGAVYAIVKAELASHNSATAAHDETSTGVKP